MELFIVPPKFIDRAWKDGAHMLSEATAKAATEITADQLKLMLSRGERALAVGLEDGKAVAWVVLEVIQYPNTRALFVYSLYAPGNAGEGLMDKLKEMARAEGCSSVRGACDEVGERLWRSRFGAKRIYAVCELAL